MRLRNDIECTLCLDDSFDLAHSVATELYLMRRYLAHSEHDPEEYNCLIDLPEDIQKLYRRATRLEHLCIELDYENCPPARSQSEEDELDIPPVYRWEDFIPLSEYPKLLSKLKTTVASEGGRQCHICKEDMTCTVEHCPTITRCGHVFGRACLECAVDVQGKCPMCREEIPGIGHLLYRLDAIK